MASGEAMQRMAVLIIIMKYGLHADHHHHQPIVLVVASAEMVHRSGTGARVCTATHCLNDGHCDEDDHDPRCTSLTILDVVVVLYLGDE